MRLGDLDALKEEVNKKKVVGRFNTILLIDNAPTVEAYTFEQVKELVDLNKKLSEERPQGEWIEKVERRGYFAGDKTVYSYTCPFCGVKEFKKYPFCHCGADMRKGGKE